MDYQDVREAIIEGQKHHNKLVYWILGTVTTIVLALAGAMGMHQLSQTEIVRTQLIGLQAESAARTVEMREVSRRLDRIETHLDKIEELSK